jgi:hypothetical protein
MYSAVIEDQATTVAADLFQIEGNTVIPVIHYITISQNLDFGDAAAEMIVIKIRRVTDAVTTPLATKNQMDSGDSAGGADVITYDTTQLTTGAATIFAENWNIALPFIWMPPPEQRIVVPTANAVVVTMEAPDDSLTISATMIWEEIGGA